MTQIVFKIDGDDFKKFKMICVRLETSMSDLLRNYVDFVIEKYWG